MKNLNEIFASLTAFRKDEAGAVTVDFVVVTGAVVGLGLALMASVSGGTLDLGYDISNALTAMGPAGDLPLGAPPPLN